jgi:hypothetical protein
MAASAKRRLFAATFVVLARLTVIVYPPRPVLPRPFMALLFAAATTVGCAPEIGDDCESSLDCSSQGTRLCDRTQPSGYCTIRGCEEGSCPDEAVCVLFRANVDRLAESFCMLKCDDDGDCREGDGYECTRADDFGAAQGETEILGRASQKFCAAEPAEAPVIDDGPVIMSGPEPPDDADDAGTEDDAGN